MTTDLVDVYETDHLSDRLYLLLLVSLMIWMTPHPIIHISTTTSIIIRVVIYYKVESQWNGMGRETTIHFQIEQ